MIPEDIVFAALTNIYTVYLYQLYLLLFVN